MSFIQVLRGPLVRLFLIWILASSLSVSARRCTEFESTSICNPWNQNKLKLDLDQLDIIYRTQKPPASRDHHSFGVKEWEAAVRNATTGKNPKLTSKRVWNTWASCPNYQGEAIQYATSVICLMDIFVHSRKCNQDLDEESIPAFCGPVCKGYSQALDHLISNTTICPVDDENDDDEQKAVSKRKSLVKKMFKKCSKISSLSFFDQSKCVLGVESDQISCGFGGNSTISKSFCAKYPQEQCCSSLKTLPSFNAFAPIHNFMQSFSSALASSATSPRTTIKGNSTAVIIVAVVLVLVVCVGIGVWYYRRRSSFASMDLKGKGKSLDDTTTLIGKEDTYPTEQPSTLFGFSSFFGGGGATSSSSTAVAPEGKKLRCIVKYAYTPNLPDEIELQVGDIVEFESISDDGWGVCVNTASGEHGQACTRFMEIID